MINDQSLYSLERMLLVTSPEDWIAAPFPYNDGTEAKQDEWYVANNKGQIVASNINRNDALLLVAVKNMLPALIKAAKKGIADANTAYPIE